MSAAVDNYHSITARPIRPLPKRRLRSRLSEDADSSLFAAPPAPAAPLFYFPYNTYPGDAGSGGGGGGAGDRGGRTGSASSGGFGSSGHGAGDVLQESSDEDADSCASVSRGVDRGVVASYTGANGAGVGVGGGGTADPYEWTENTNNKKKRKIPTHTNPGGSTGAGGGGAGCGGTHASPGFSPTSTPKSRWKSNGSSLQRSPLAATGGATTVTALRRPARRHPSTDKFAGLVAGKQKEEPVTPTKGKRRRDGGTADSGFPKQTQFTFTYDSPVSMPFASSSTTSPPSAGTTAGGASAPARSMHTVGTQTSPGMSNSSYQPQPPAPAKKKTPKPSRRELFQQAQRRRRQEALSHNNNNGEIWICEFCEYESIFGEPPEALMRQYEIKDRKERRRLAEKRRLLEKAKQKGKKNASKNAGKKGANNHASAAPPPPPPPSTTDSQGTQSDNTPLASASQTPALKPTRNSQQVQTEACLESSLHVSNGRGAAGKASTTDNGTSAKPL
ncbi:hypothetical protein BZA05DRAFT_196751 [Tricharina praecox]|uniref:uncharacterized protein n=1 Tax=Tricharina praecox TaxID=43433 RepID=UPI00221F8D96|nr:uncharacterized protein BZA05DRAFT_196751 [Tricharina praecox]KAI5856253.1 hypothetical protein BZA05DRAFT_196751 [Tricharina praecox]